MNAINPDASLLQKPPAALTRLQGDAQERAKISGNREEKADDESLTTGLKWAGDSITASRDSVLLLSLATTPATPMQSLEKRRASSPALEKNLGEHRSAFINARSHNLIEKAFALGQVMVSGVKLFFQGISFAERQAFEAQVKQERREELIGGKLPELAQAYANIELFG